MNPDHLRNIFMSIASKNLQVLNLSNCNMRDHGFILLCECLRNKELTLYTYELNVASNNLSLASIKTILNFLCHCIIEKLIIEDNFISEYELTEALMKQCQSGKPILNFIKYAPLVVNGALLTYAECGTTTSITYLTINLFKSIRAFILELDDHMQLYKILCLDVNQFRNVSVTVC